MKKISQKSIELLKEIVKKVGRKRVNEAILKNTENPHKELMNLLHKVQP